MKVREGGRVKEVSSLFYFEIYDRSSFRYSMDFLISQFNLCRNVEALKIRHFSLISENI